MTGDSPVPTRPGVRACSRITIEATCIHDGDPRALADHLAAEVGAVARRWGIDVDDTATSYETVVRGDLWSVDLPTIGCPHREDDR